MENVNIKLFFFDKRQFFCELLNVFAVNFFPYQFRNYGNKKTNYVFLSVLCANFLVFSHASEEIKKIEMTYREKLLHTTTRNVEEPVARFT